MFMSAVIAVTLAMRTGERLEAYTKSCGPNQSGDLRVYLPVGHCQRELRCESLRNHWIGDRNLEDGTGEESQRDQKNLEVQVAELSESKSITVARHSCLNGRRIERIILLRQKHAHGTGSGILCYTYIRHRVQDSKVRSMMGSDLR